MFRAIALSLLLVVGMTSMSARAQDASPSESSLAEARSLFERGLAAAETRVAAEGAQAAAEGR